MEVQNTQIGKSKQKRRNRRKNKNNNQKRKGPTNEWNEKHNSNFSKTGGKADTQFNNNNVSEISDSILLYFLLFLF